MLLLDCGTKEDFLIVAAGGRILFKDFEPNMETPVVMTGRFLHLFEGRVVVASSLDLVFLRVVCGLSAQL